MSYYFRTLKNLILWQGFEKPKGIAEKILYIFTLLFSFVMIFGICLLIHHSSFNVFIKIFLYIYTTLNFLLMGCYFDGRAYYTGNLFFKIVHLSGLGIIAVINLPITILYLRKLKGTNEI